MECQNVPVFKRLRELIRSRIPFTASTGDFVQPTLFKDPKSYITTIGLYNDAGELLVVGRTAKPIKNDDKTAMSFVVRFDV